MIEQLEKINNGLAHKMGQFFSVSFNKAMDTKGKHGEDYGNHTLYRIMARMETLLYIGRRSLEDNYKLEHLTMDKLYTFNTTCTENLHEIYELYVELCQRKNMAVRITFEELAKRYGQMVMAYLNGHIIH